MIYIIIISHMLNVSIKEMTKMYKGETIKKEKLYYMSKCGTVEEY